MPAEPSAQHFEGPAAPASLDQIHALIDDLWSARPEVPTVDRMAFTTSIAEIVANVIEHAAIGDATLLTLVLDVEPNELIGVVTDNGRPYIGSSLDRPPDESEDGRGLLMARVLTDLTYERTPTHNCWRVVRNWLPA